MQIKVKLPFDKFSRSDVGHAIQVMALDCRVVEFYSPQEALIEFEESYLDGLEGENKTKYLSLLVDYTEPEVFITGIPENQLYEFSKPFHDALEEKLQADWATVDNEAFIEPNPVNWTIDPPDDGSPNWQHVYNPRWKAEMWMSQYAVDFHNKHYPDKPLVAWQVWQLQTNLPLPAKIIDSGAYVPKDNLQSLRRGAMVLSMPSKVTALPDGGYLIESDAGRLQNSLDLADDALLYAQAQNQALRQQLQEAYEIFRCTDYQLIDAAAFYREHDCPGVAESLEKQYYNIKRWLESYNKGR